MIPSFLGVEIQSNKIQNNTESTNEEDVINLPKTFCWCDVDGVDYSTPIKNQAPLPTCEAYALCAALETMANYEVGHNFNCDLSEIHLFFCSGGDEAWGVNVQDAANYLVKYGVPDEGCLPEPRRKAHIPCSETLEGWEERTVKIESWGWVENDVESIKQALVEYGPLVICNFVRTDFMIYNRGIYRNIWGDIEGGHVMSLFGYNDVQKYWLIKNSWGKNWGDDGWIKVSYNAHRGLRPFFAPFYGGSGIMYLDGIYGNLQPDVPRIYIDRPLRGYTYYNFLSWQKSWLRENYINSNDAIIIKGTLAQLDVSEDTEYVEVYIDKELVDTITGPVFDWYLSAQDYGLHELRFIAYNDEDVGSMAMMDVFTVPIEYIFGTK